jgi:hypothetical protein
MLAPPASIPQKRLDLARGSPQIVSIRPPAFAATHNALLAPNWPPGIKLREAPSPTPALQAAVRGPRRSRWAASRGGMTGAASWNGTAARCGHRASYGLCARAPRLPRRDLPA